MHGMSMQKLSSSKLPECSKQEESSESLENTLPEGLVVDRTWLGERGISRSNVDT